jgi:pimeloyl-ACP methyl ester carboxylesterase
MSGGKDGKRGTPQGGVASPLLANILAGARQMIREGITGGGNVLIAAFEKRYGPIADAHAARLRAADLEAYLAAAQDGAAMEDMLGTMAMPCCIYAGEADPLLPRAKLSSERIPNARFFSLPGLSHLQVFAESSRVLPQVIEFLATSR